MIYTIGHTESYERCFAEQEFPAKLGKTKDYEGGSVWQTFEEAAGYIGGSLSGFSVYGVEADWEKDTEPNDFKPFNNLLKTSRLIKISVDKPLTSGI